ncbi:MAG: MarR family transcriptional regulator [Actinobacteria bacterium]|nr:MarR family transcriptional regulator [Actinomycetota bacterium]
MTDRPEPGCGQAGPSRAEIEAVLIATRVLVAISAQSVAQVEDRVTLPQLRVLVMIASRGPQNLSSVAQALGVHPSNATRTCDKLVEAGLIHRRDNPADRRNLILELTESGRQLLQTMNSYRRTAITNILAKMLPQQRSSLVPELLAFADAAGETPDSQTWSLGWTSEPPDATITNSSESTPPPCPTECGHRSG